MMITISFQENKKTISLQFKDIVFLVLPLGLEPRTHRL